MGLLHEIQESVVQDQVDLGSVLLKLRLLASRLGSGYLEEWVKHESEGYPKDVEVPGYRKVGVSYRGTFSGPFGSGIKNAPIPTYLVEQYAGAKWVRIDIRESIAAVDEMVKKTADGGTLGIDSSNLILLLQGKVYEDYACNDIQGTISSTSLSEIRQAVRSRILELTLELEKSVPDAVNVSFGPAKSSGAESAERVEKISQQIIYGNVTTITGGAGGSVTVAIGARDDRALIDFLVDAGLPKEDASELASIMASEEPSSLEEPFGERAKTWLGANLKKAAGGAWGMGVTVATKVLSEAALKYYGLK